MGHYFLDTQYSKNYDQELALKMDKNSWRCSRISKVRFQYSFSESLAGVKILMD